MSGPVAHTTDAQDRTLLPEYEEWLVRVEMTRESVAYCCFHRLGRNDALADHVSVEVVGGLLSRPMVWQYFGLPFSGRVAHLTEKGLARVAQGDRRGASRWPAVREELLSLPPEHQRVVTLTCCDGLDDSHLAAALGCDEPRAASRREEALEYLARAADRAFGREPTPFPPTREPAGGAE